jgi:ketosteroid isomerase-like protein
MTTHRSTPIAVAALLLLSLACGQAPAGLSGTSEAVSADAPRQALQVADSVLAANVLEQGPVDGFWPFLAQGAVFLEPGLAILHGRDAIRSALAAVQPPAPAPVLRLHRVAAVQSDDGHLGFTYGWTELVAADGTVAYGKYAATWRRDAGHWRIEAFSRAPSYRAPTPPPEGNPVVFGGYHGVSIPGDPAELAADVAATDSAFAAMGEAQGTCTAFPAFADENAVVFGGNNFRYGMDWVRIAYGSGCTPQDHATWAPLYSASTGSGDLGWSVGNATFSYDDGSSVLYSYSKYLTVWARQPDGTWRWLADTGSARP